MCIYIYIYISTYIEQEGYADMYMRGFFALGRTGFVALTNLCSSTFGGHLALRSKSLTFNPEP